MKAITVQQPWAWAIIHGGKNIENRTSLGTWRTAQGTTIAIHAGRRWSERGANSWLVNDAWYQHGTFAHDVDRSTFEMGAIIGTVMVTEVHWQDNDCDPEICGLWGERSYVEHGGTNRTSLVHLVLEQPRPVDPIPCKGALGLWTVPDDVRRELEAVAFR